MAEDRLTTLYNLSESMTTAGDQVKEKHEEDYKKIIEYLKTSKDNKERVLAAQLIARFFKFFPELENTAFDPIVDLCESTDVDVRKHATLAMISICRGSKQVVSKAADILIQLYQTDQPSEVTLINQSLATLLNLNIEQFLKSFFANFEDGDEIVRERALKFLSSKIQSVADSALTKEVEEQLMAYTKKAMEDVTKEEFISFVSILSKLKISKTATGQATLVSAIKAQAELTKPFNVNDKETLDKFLLCTKNTIPFLSQYNRASEYISYICLNILPHLSDLAPTGNDLNVLQVLAEMSPFIIQEDVPSLIDLDQCVKAVLTKLLEYLPMPPEPGTEITAPKPPPATAAAQQPDAKTVGEAAPEASGANSDESSDQKDSGEKQPAGEEQAVEKTATTAASESAPAATAPAQAKSSIPPEADFQFTHIEYLMFTFVQLCRHKPELYTEAMQIENRKQLSHLSNGCKKYTDALERQLTSVKRTDLNKEENKLRSIALRTTKNISTMILGLFKRPADFKTNIVLSCKPVKLEATTSPVASNINNNNNTNQNNNYNKPRQTGYNKPQQNNGNYNNRGGGGGGYNNNRQAGQKSKFKGNYQADYRSKRPRSSR